MNGDTSLKWFVLASLGFGGFLIYLLAPILMPFMAAAILAYIADPLVDRLEGWKLSRTLSVVVVFSGLTVVSLLCLLLLVPMLERQFVTLAEKLPLYLDRAQAVLLPWLKESLGLESQPLDLQSLKSSISAYWKEAGGVVAKILSYLSHSGLVLVGWIANLLLMFVVTFYLLRDWDVMVSRIHAMLPRRMEPTISKLARESDEVLGAFLRGQLLVMLALSLVYTIGLKIAGLDLALVIGMLSGVVSFVPYLGFIVGIVSAGVAALMQFQDAVHLVYVAAVFMVGQALEGMLLTPLLVGDRIGLHPVAVIFAVLAGGQLFGFLGVLLALPLAAVIAVVIRHLYGRYTESELYRQQAG